MPQQHLMCSSIRKRGEFQSNPHSTAQLDRHRNRRKNLFRFFFQTFTYVYVTPASNKRGVYKSGGQLCVDQIVVILAVIYYYYIFQEKKYCGLYIITLWPIPFRRKMKNWTNIYIYIRARRWDLYNSSSAAMSVICRHSLCLSKGVCCVANCLVSLYRGWPIRGCQSSITLIIIYAAAVQLGCDLF